jgi:hypothetical protein
MFNNVFLAVTPFMRQCGQIWYSLTGTDDIIIRRMYISCCINKTTDTHSECVTLLLFHDNNGYVNSLQSYVIRTLPLVSLHCFS